jgi:hypothetical protein
LQLALQDAAARHGLSGADGRWFDIVTGSATGPGNAALLDDRPGGLARFRAAVRSDPEELSAVASFLGRTKRGWQCGRQVGLLVEANTAWGAQVLGSKDNNKDRESTEQRCNRCLNNPDFYYQSANAPSLVPLPCASVAHFPLHVSRVRAESQRAQAAASPQIARNRATIPLDLGESVPPSDQVPAESPQVTASTVETMMSGVFEVLNDFQVSAIGVLATDKRDHIYLAEEIARHRPDVLPFTLESNLLYLHPDAVDFVRGTLIASTYPLNPRTQRLTQRVSRNGQQFGSAPSQGIYNALALLLGRSEILVDYAPPDAPSDPLVQRDRAAGCSLGAGTACAPPVWLSVVGRDALLPLAVVSGDCASGSSNARAYVTCRPTALAASNAGPPTRGESSLPSYFDSRRIPLLESALLITLLLGVQVWVYRWANERMAADANRVWPERGSRREAMHPWLRAVSGVAWAAAAPGPFVAELNAGLAAMRGATLVLVLWASKVGLIYLCDAFGIPMRYAQSLVCVLAMCGLAYVLWHIIQAFWSPARGWRSILARAAVLVFTGVVLLAIGLADWMSGATARARVALAVCVAALAVLADTVERDAVSAQALRIWRRVAALLGLGALLGVLVDLGFQHWDAIEPLFYAYRAGDLNSFMSPTASLVPICIALFWWGIWNVHRVYLMLLPETSVGVGPLLDQTTRAVGLDPEAMFSCSAQGIGWRIVPLTVVLVLVLLYGQFYVGNIEGRAFSVFLLLGPLCVAAAVGHTLAHSTALGAAVMRVLRALESHPASASFQAVGQSAFNWEITFRDPRYYQLQPLLLALERIARVPSGMLGSAAAPPQRRWLESLRTITPRVLKELRKHHRGVLAASLLSRHDWETLNSLLRCFAHALQMTRWRADSDATTCPAPAQHALADMAYAVTFQAAIVLRDVLTRLVSGFTIVLGALLLLLAAHLFYSFQGRVYWLLLDATAILITAGLGLRLLIAFERDGVMSRIWRTTPGKISLFRGLTWRMALYVAVSLGTLFVVLFPELAGRSGRWLTSAAGMLH